MSNLAEAGRVEIGHPRKQTLIMHWIGICSDPKSHRAAALSQLATSTIVHREQLVARWLNEIASRSRSVA